MSTEPNDYFRRRTPAARVINPKTLIHLRDALTFR
jgi:hypothetical protein